MSLRLYQADKYYLLDFQNLAVNDDRSNAFWLPKEANGEQEQEMPGAHTMEFFELCTMVISVCGFLFACLFVLKMYFPM